MIIATALAMLMPQASPTVTFQYAAAPASQVIAALATQEKLELDTSTQMANDFIVVDVENVPIQTLLDKIATATSGVWEPDGTVMRLKPSVNARLREAQAEGAATLAALRKDVAERVKALSPSVPTVQEDKDMPPMNLPGMGSEGAITRLLAGIDLTPIAQMTAGDRIVFATNPNQMQRRLPANTPQLIATVVKEHNEQAANRDDSAFANDEDYSKLPDFMKKMIEDQMKPIGTPAKALLIVSQQGFGMGMYSVELRLLDEKGKKILSQPSYLGSSKFMAAAMRGKDTKEKTSVKSTPITYSADSKALLEGMQNSPTNGMQIKISPAVREVLAHPDQKDPLSFMATDELMSLAKLKKKALVASVGDSMMQTLNMMVPGSKQTVEDFENDLKAGDDETLSETEGWIIAKPANPVTARTNRTNRTGLAALLKATAEKGVPSLDDLATYAVTSPSPASNSVGQFYAAFLVPGMMMQGMDGMGDWNALQFYGSLNQTQRAVLNQGSSLSIAQMAPAQRQLWAKMVFGANATIKAGPPAKDEDETGGMMALFMGSMGGGDTTEPTELLPNGLAGNCFLQFAVTKEPYASPVGEGDSSMIAAASIMGPTEIAALKMFSEDPTFSSMSGMMPQIGQVRIGERDIIHMNLILPGDNYFDRTLQDNHPPTGAPVAFNNLPAGFQATVNKRLEALKSSPLGSLGGMMGAFGRMGGGNQP